MSAHSKHQDKADEHGREKPGRGGDQGQRRDGRPYGPFEMAYGAGGVVSGGS
ncbi:hypothetical protein [Streptomyces zagrosensis]|uniref:Uncharacterized protein n=1 Tax=Streptomyces zagrosensis TaxID=1042984 RepID=A0A7W9UWD4_9ACTN|nr:hypothetical protein [Streptomyces zagrosensis]MBB5933780.1 hypothetical protein [Streptomyces zagrosensis]